MGYGRFSPTSIEAVERRIMLSADPVTDVMVAPDSDAGIADQIATYSSQSSDQAEEYALQVEEAYLDPTQEGLELAMEEFFADSSEAASDYDPYAGLSESPVGVYLAGYDSELSSINPSSATDSGAPSESSADPYASSYSVVVASNDGSSTVDSAASSDSSGSSISSEQTSIFDYDNQISLYADNLISSALSAGQGEDDGYGSSGSDTESESSSGSDPNGDSDAIGGTADSPSSSDSTGTSDGSRTSSESTSNPGSTSNESATNGGDATPESKSNPFVAPAGLELSNVQLPAEVTGGDFFAIQPQSQTSFTTTQSESIAPVTKSVTDPKLGQGEETSSASATVTTTQTWVSPTDWTITHSLSSSFSINGETTDGDGVTHGAVHAGTSSVSITVSSLGVTVVSYSATDSRSRTQQTAGITPT
jgi:hypothetical protein